MGQARALAALGCSVFLATGSKADFIPSGIFAGALSGLDLGPNITSFQLRETVRLLHEFVAQEEITLIHAHPFYTMPVGFLVAVRANLPLALTLHGPLSVTARKSVLAEALSNHLLPRLASVVFSVSRETQLLWKVKGGQSIFLPNAVSVPSDRITAPPITRGWMWAGRIDRDKTKGLRSLLEAIRGLKIRLDIYGDGSERDDLARFIAGDLTLSRFVRMAGWAEDLSETYAKYSVVAGMGRVMIEAGISQRPCLLVGYEGVHGFLDRESIEDAAYSNFSGRGLEVISPTDFLSQLADVRRNRKRYNISKWIRAERNIESAMHIYLEQIKQLRPPHETCAAEVLEAISHQDAASGPVWEDVNLARLVVGLANTHGFFYNQPLDHGSAQHPKSQDTHERALYLKLLSAADLVRRVNAKVLSLQSEKARALETISELEVRNKALERQVAEVEVLRKQAADGYQLAKRETAIADEDEEPSEPGE